uniref:Reverse transcriptase domain-containing protein n=1 Tax=Tanacetum cinerariifolium TaxID=118510 RepID=A0A699IAV7_TANCI|nr:hypothetical protein [Tanacetum cinerariifolium]
MAPVTRQGPSTLPNNANLNNMTPESIQAMIDQALLRNCTNGDGSHSSHEDNRRNVQTARPCFYADFMKCHPLNFKGTEGVVGLTRWIEKMESVFQINGCAIENQGEIKKLEIELWNLKVKENNVPGYTEHFQELTLICTKFVANETEKIDKYVSGHFDNIYESVKASKPKMLDETIELANDLMDQKLRTYAERQSTTNERLMIHSEITMVTNSRPPKEVLEMQTLRMLRGTMGEIPKGNEKRGNASKDPYSNVVTGTFLLNNRYESILFETGADRSFISTAFSTLIDIVPTILGNSYDVELADGKIVRISAKKEEDMSEGKQLEDVSVVRDYPEVFPKDLPGLPPV